jgi:F-type H+-transporting ATPase subunit delta
MEKVFKEEFSDTIVGFLVIIVQKGRYNDIPAIFQYFLEQVMEYKNIGTAKVTSAVALTDEQKAAVEKRLLEVTKYVKFNMEYAVDESLIGGMVIRIGDRVVDSSIRSQINSMAKDLMKIQLN